MRPCFDTTVRAAGVVGGYYPFWVNESQFLRAAASQEPRAARAPCSAGRVRRLLLALVAAIDASRGELSSHVWVGGALHSACPSFLRVNAGGTDLG
eukprot:COSAG05_NODE_14519_length_394_cov_1.810169_1_plen_95_part_01